jgi:hypothetical protein
LCRSRNEHAAAVIMIARDAQADQAIRALFEQQGIRALQDYSIADAGAVGASNFLIYPLPLEAVDVVSLTTQLLRTGYALSDVAGLDFRYYEV